MEKQTILSRGEWQIMEYLWQRPHTLMELVDALGKNVGWSKSTVATMVRRMEEKGILAFEQQGRTKFYHPVISREAAASRETQSLLQRVYSGSLGLMVHTMIRSKDLTRADIEELYEILKKAEEDAT